MKANGLLAQSGRKYPLLNDDEIISAIEVGTAYALTDFFGAPSSAVWTETGLVMQVYRPNKVVVIDGEELSKQTRRHLMWCIDREMMRLHTLAELERYKSFVGMIVYGEVESVLPSGSINIWVALDAGGITVEQRVGHYPFKFQPIKERNKYKVGDTLPFYVSSVLPVKGPGGSSYLRLNLSRTAKLMPKVFLESLQKDIEVEVIERIPGYKTILTTNKKIKKEHIVTVSRALRESLVFKRQ